MRKIQTTDRWYGGRNNSPSKTKWQHMQTDLDDITKEVETL